MAEIKKIGVLGAGRMGAGIAHVAAMKGMEVILQDIGQSILERSIERMHKLMQKMVKEEKMTFQDAKDALQRIQGTTRIEDLAEAGFIIEAIIENLPAKKEIFAKLDQMCKDDVILVSNTSSISITAIAASTKRADRVAGMHFFNPPQLMKLVEVIRGYYTSDLTVQTVSTVAEQMGKVTVEVKNDSPGFVVNRLLAPQLNEAVKLLQEGVASPEDIDKAIKLGLNHPMGPFELMDLTGIDICHNVMEYFSQEFNAFHYAPPLMLKQMLRANRLGRKNGKGWYEYEKGGN